MNNLQIYMNPLLNAPQVFTVPVGGNLFDFVEKSNIQFTGAITAIIIINGEIIPQDAWELTFPTEKDLVSVRIIPRGGSGGKNVTRTVLSLAAIVAANFFAPGLALALTPAAMGLTGLAATTIVTQLALTYAGLALVDAIAPIPTQDTAITKSSSKDSKEFYNIGGSNNKLDPWGSIPVLFGTHKFSPPYAARPYTVVQNNEQFVRMLFCLGYSPIEILELKIGECIITGSIVSNDDFGDNSGSVNYEATLYDDFNPTTDETHFFEEICKEETLSIELKESLSWITQYTASDTDHVIVDISALNGIYEVDEAGDYQNTTVNFEVQYREYGTETWYDANATIPISDETLFYPLDDVALARASWPIPEGEESNPASYYYKHKLVKIGIMKSTGAPYMKIIYGTSYSTSINSVTFPSTVYPIAYIHKRFDPFLDGSTMKYPAETDLSPSDITDLRTSSSPPRENSYDFACSIYDDSIDPSDVYVASIYNDSNYAPAYFDDFYNFPGELETAFSWVLVPSDLFGWYASLWFYNSGGVEKKLYNLLLLAGGSLTSAGGLTAKSSDKIVQSYYCELPSSAKYEIRIRRTTVDHDPVGSRKQDTIHWTCLRSFNRSKKAINMAGLTFLEMYVKASDEFNNSLDTVTVLGQALITTDFETPTVAYSNNCADIVRYIYTGPFNKKALTDSQVDLTTLSAFYTLCAGLGFSYNRYIDSSTSVYEILKEVCAACLASPTYKDGLYSVVYDYLNTTITQMITPRNSWGFKATKKFYDIPHAYRVEYADRYDDYKLTELEVYNEDYDENNATLFEQLEYPGVTNANQINSLTNFHFGQLRTRRSSFFVNMDVENIVCTRGDKVLYSSDVLSSTLTVGRLQTYSGETIVVDNICTMEAGKSYGIVIRSTGGTAVYYSVTTVEGDNTLLTISLVSPAPEAIEGEITEDCLFMFGEYENEAFECLVKAIVPGEDLSAELELVIYDASIYPAMIG